ncbi:tetratricopeptide (TPR) repeat protein [Catalinimonas alkaloidigena]|uniref:tetratricopeptide repeat protein n=1 Tax=Catalinimonas alkaloidigena TaxID=1075417 RepID=UPI0024055960|nr:tetratricopeptide repeat protein [Catalinimonas alkaloidigena]MDF9800844.1 tetratricopeptide (TPR) repeat protein [Catalinimonas alkaloidigena]
MSEEIINALSRINGLKVTARTSSFAFKGLKEDVRIIGNKLGVASVIEGSVRKAGKRVRITIQLIRTDNGFHLWSENFDRKLSDIFALQDEISLLVADKIRENFDHMEISDHLVTSKTSNAEAYQLLLKGSFHFKRKDLEDIQKALAYFQDALQLDPDYAEAHAFIGETYLHYAGFNLITAEKGHSEAREAAEKALQINENEARAHKVLAYIHLFYDWDWDGAIASYNRAIESGLTNENEFITYYYIFIQKDYDQAIRIAKENVVKDPLHVISHWQLGLCYYFAGRFEEALHAFEQSLQQDSNFSESLRWKGVVLGYLGRFEEALTAIEQALTITRGEGLALLDRLTVKILQQEHAGVVEEIEQMQHLDPCDPAALYSLLNMPEKAVAWLEKGLEARSVMMVSLKHFWIWNNIRQDAAFQRIYKSMHFHEQRALKADPRSHQLQEGGAAKLSSEEIVEVTEAISQLLMDEANVTDQSLSLRSLAEAVNLHPNKLSWLLNRHVGKNFNEFINQYRLEIFKQKALAPDNHHLTLLGLAYESGFNSKSVFNDYFKKSTGLTPRAWVKAQAKV